MFVSVGLRSSQVGAAGPVMSVPGSVRSVVNGVLTQQFTETGPSLDSVGVFHIIIASNTASQLQLV